MNGNMDVASYFPFHYKLLRLIGLGYYHYPVEKNFQNFSKAWYVIYSSVQFTVWVVSFSIALWIKVPYIIDDLEKLMLNLTFSITFTTTFVKLYIFYFHHKPIQEIVWSIDQEFQEIMVNVKILRQCVEQCKKVSVSVLTFANLTVVGLVASGAIQAQLSPAIFYKTHKHDNQTQFSPADRSLPLPVYLPFNITSSFVYAIAFTYQILGIFWNGNMVIIINTLMYSIFIHLAAKFENLQFIIEHLKSIIIMKMSDSLQDNTSQLLSDDNIRTIETLTANNINIEMNSNGDVSYKGNVYLKRDINKNMIVYIKRCIQNHIKLLQCVRKFEEAYSVGFLIHVINNLLIICNIMIQVMMNNITSVRGLTAIALFITVVSEMLAQCYAGNHLTLQSLSVADGIYKCGWYEADREFKKLILIMKMRAQVPVNVMAGKFVSISNSTFISIMKGTYSFFALIKSMKK